MTLRALSFDFDGSLTNIQYERSEIKDIVACNQLFLDAIKEENKQFSQTIVFDGSLRQSKAHDDYVSRRNTTGSCFLALLQMAAYLDAQLCPILLADIFGDLPDGTSYHRILNNPTNGTHAPCIPDETKLTILYSQIHHIANIHPNESIVFDFFDDREDILFDLSTFFNKYTVLLPNHICLRLNQYKNNELSLYGTINGTGENIDTFYRQTIINMIENTTLRMNHSSRRCADEVTPSTLDIDYLPKTNETTINWVTKKTKSLQLTIEEKQKKEMSVPPFAPEIHILQTLAHLKKTIPQNDIQYEYITHAMLNRLRFFYQDNKPITIEIIKIVQDIRRVEQAHKIKGIRITPPLICEIQNSRRTIKELLFTHASDYLLRKHSSGEIDNARAHIQHNRCLLEHTDKQGMTPLDIAISNENDALAIFLIEEGSPITAAQGKKKHAIHITARNGRLDLVQTLLQQNKELINTLDEYNKTPLLWAASRGHSEVVEWLIMQGADINIASQNAEDHKIHNYSPLDWARLHLTKANQTIFALENAGAKANHSNTSVLLDNYVLLDALGEYETDQELFGEDELEHMKPTAMRGTHDISFFHSTPPAPVTPTSSTGRTASYQKL